MAEREQLAAVTDLAARFDVYWHHCLGPARHCGGQSGLPDLILVGKRGILFPELKADGHRRTPEQTDWYWRLRQAGALTPLWQPSAFRTGAVEQQISWLGGA